MARLSAIADEARKLRERMAEMRAQGIPIPEEMRQRREAFEMELEADNESQVLVMYGHTAFVLHLTCASSRAFSA